MLTLLRFAFCAVLVLSMSCLTAGAQGTASTDIAVAQAQPVSPDSVRCHDQGRRSSPVSTNCPVVDVLECGHGRESDHDQTMG